MMCDTPASRNRTPEKTFINHGCTQMDTDEYASEPERCIYEREWVWQRTLPHFSRYPCAAVVGL